MPQEIGANFKTLIPSLSDDASIEKAFQMYHYGTAAYNGSNLQNNSIEKHFIDLEDSINNLRSELNFSQLGNVKLVSTALSPNVVSTEDVATVPITVRGIINQSVTPLQKWQRTVGTTSSDVAVISPLGSLGLANYASIGNVSVSPLTTGVSVSLSNATHKGVTIRGVDGQSANLQEWQNNNGVVLASISATGNLASKSAEITGTLRVTSTTTLESGLSVSGGTTTLGNTSISGTFSAPSLSLTQTGANALSVSGTSSFSDNVTITGNTTSVKDLSISGTTSATGSIASSGSISSSGTLSGASLSISANASITGNLGVAGIFRAKSPGTGTTGGVRIIADSSGNSYLQFANAADNAELANIKADSTNVTISRPLVVSGTISAGSNAISGGSITGSSISVGTGSVSAGSLTIGSTANSSIGGTLVVGATSVTASSSGTVRNVWHSTSAPGTTAATNGDIWLQYV